MLFIQRGSEHALHHNHSSEINSNNEKVTTAEENCLLGHKGDKLDKSTGINQRNWFDRLQTANANLQCRGTQSAVTRIK